MFSDNRHNCRECGEYDLNVGVYREYFHILFVPCFPTGATYASAYCRNCSTRYRIEKVLAEYEKDAKRPFYLYSGLILMGILVGIIAFAIGTGQKEKNQLVSNPAVGDVYLVRSNDEDNTGYYFLRINQIDDDQVYMFHNNLIYSKFVSKLAGEDFFLKGEEIKYTKQDLMKMLKDGEVSFVKRHYNQQDFNKFD